jgi:DNA-binding MarR family transcriptional regulator
MTEHKLPSDPKNSRFGWPQPARIEEFKKLSSSQNSPTTRIVFKGNNEDLPIVRVPIELPKYRMANGRTVSLQAEYLAQNPKDRDDLFSGDPELWDAQEVQHSLLLQVAKQSDLQKYFEDTANKQIDPILLDENGFVINGNRRLACWRELLYKEPGKYSHFRNIDVAILPHCDEKEIDRLEAALQIEKDIKAEYSWDAKANMMLAKQKRYGFSNKDLGDLYGMKEPDVKELLDMLSYANEYLRSRDQTDRWSLVSTDEFAFKRLVNSRQKITNAGTQELFKQAAFTLIEKPDEAGGRLYEAIPAIAENLSVVKEKLLTEFEVVATSSAKSDELEEFFGGGVRDTGTSSDILLAQEIQKPENATRVRSIIVEVIESQKQLKKDAKAEGYLLKCCSNAQAALAAGIKDGLRPESKRDGVEKQLAQIEAQVTTIREYLQKHAEN